MKRVLQIIATLRIGGAETVARDIGLYGDSREYEMHYIVFGENVGEYEQELLAHGNKVFHWISPSASYPQYYASLKKLIRKEQYDVVHAHTMFNIGWAMLAAKQCGVPIRVSHAHSSLDNGRSIKKSAYEAIMRHMIVQNATHMVACGDVAGARLYGEKTYKKSGICILNGIDTVEFSYKLEKRNRIRKAYCLEDSFVIGHAGHLMGVKNQSYLIRLMPELLKYKPNAKLLLLGEGEDRPMLEQLIRELELKNHVIMTGNVRNVSDYLSAMDVFAFPSLFEGMPLSIIEVQANGLPCVLSDRIPSDIFLTDLIQRIPLEQTPQWIEFICSAERKKPEEYSERLRLSGFDTENVMRKFYNIYEGVNQS